MATKPLDNEAELLAKIASGDQHAFRIIFEKYHNKVYTYASRILTEDMLAEEVVQETMLKIWTLGQKLTGIDNLDAYLKATARNKSIDMLRRIEQQHQIETEQSADWTEQSNETEEQILLNDTRRVLTQAISQLPDQQRRVYELCHLQGMKYEEAATELQLSVETVKFYMKLALRFLRSYLSTHTDVAVFLIILKLI